MCVSELDEDEVVLDGNRVPVVALSPDDDARRLVRKLLGNSLETIVFGFPGDVRIRTGQTDETEIDMALPGVYCEAKLTESDFTHKRKAVVESYDGLAEAFHVEMLPRVGEDCDDYQVIRNLLAAMQHERARKLLR